MLHSGPLKVIFYLEKPIKNVQVKGKLAWPPEHNDTSLTPPCRLLFPSLLTSTF